MNLPRTLAKAASSMSSIYKIVFTAMLLIELVKFKMKGKTKWEDFSRKL